MGDNGDGTERSERGGIPLTREEAERDYPAQFRSLTPLKGFNNTPGTVCAESRCKNHVLIKMIRDSAGNCTIYEKYSC
jgi:hypothetical protein